MSKLNDTLNDIKKRAVEALETYAGKENWKAEDLDGAKNAVKLYNEVCDAMMKDGIWNEMKEDWGNSGYNMPHGYTRISYGPDGRMYDDRYSGTRGRDGMGRFTSRNAMYHDPRYDSMGYDDGNSMHSVKDRMIAALEAQMDNAKTEYEREEVRKAIMEIEKMKR